MFIKGSNGKQIELPKDIRPTDFKWQGSFDCQKFGLDWNELTMEFWYTERFGWCIPTLLIRKRGRRMQANVNDRTYAISLNGNSVRIGLGPHVLATFEIHISHANVDRIMKYVELRRKGAVSANEIRDTISTRRMNSMLRKFASW